MSAWLPARTVICLLPALPVLSRVPKFSWGQGGASGMLQNSWMFFSPLVEETLVCPGRSEPEILQGFRG